MGSEILGILFDSGDTLVQPVGGNWFPVHRFDEIVLAHGIRDLEWHRMEDAILDGQTYLNSNHSLTTEDEEREQFQTFYDILLKGLGVDHPASSLTLELARAVVDENNMEAFPDTHRVIRRLLERGMRLGIVSDTWPSLDRKYRLLGLRHYFDPFVISAHVGVFKPHTKIFMKAIEGMGMSPENILFVDDSPKNVIGANALGLNGVLMARYGQPRAEDLRWISNLDEIEDLLQVP